MEKLLKAQCSHKIAFERILDVTIKLLRDGQDIFEIQANIRVLDNKNEILTKIHKDVVDFMFDNDFADEEIDDQMKNADYLTSKFLNLKIRVEHLVTKDFTERNSLVSQPSFSKHRIKFPVIELKKFGGEITDWLPFWSQFKRIHEDELLDNEDKFQYLIQSTIPNSRARSLVESYPPTSENYPKVVESLESRFGRADLLIEVYVRELLKLVLENLNGKFKISSLYDKLESQLRNLETLGVTSDKCAAMLYPLVESCLPEEILRAWQRNLEFSSDSSIKSRLDKLLLFLKKEVEGEERISLAASGFDLQKMKKKDILDFSTSKNTPTAAGLVNQSNPKCVFCKLEHLSINCTEALKLSHVEKKKVLSQNGCCHLCLKFGHISRKCRSVAKLKCENCNGKHATVMCFKNEHNKNVLPVKPPQVENLSNHASYQQVFLQTLLVQIKTKSNIRLARAIIDTGSQRSYICKHTALEMGYEPIREEEMIHALFGGYKSEAVKHPSYRINLKSLDNQYESTFETLDQPLICSNIECLPEGPWLTELREMNIQITDTNDGPIEILIGADIAGKIFSGKRNVLKCGLVTLETSFGWTIMGKTNQVGDRCSVSMLATTFSFQNFSISDFWNLETLGILDPVTESTKEQKEAAIQDYFVSTVTREEDGRYKVRLPWITSHAPLLSNYQISKKRLDNLMKKLEKDGYYEEYNKVFEEWLDENIIEQVLESEVDIESHYLPHRHVVKLSSATTKLRPVFDASAKEGNNPSLNQCLEKGINLIQLIPSILLRFRMGKIGIIADIRKAFLQISLFEQDRNVLRFLWYDKNGKLVIYRHARVVFGVTSSPFLLAAVINYHLEQTLNNVYSGKSTYFISTISKLLKGFYVDNCVASLDSEDDLQKFIDEARAIMSEAQFDLRLWESTIQYYKKKKVI